MAKYTVLVILFVIQMCAAWWYSHSKLSIVECTANGLAWKVNSWKGIPIFMSHVMPAMFCAAMPRVVFIKTIKTYTEEKAEEKADDFRVA